MYWGCSRTLRDCQNLKPNYLHGYIPLGGLGWPFKYRIILITSTHERIIKAAACFIHRKDSRRNRQVKHCHSAIIKCWHKSSRATSSKQSNSNNSHLGCCYCGVRVMPLSVLPLWHPLFNSESGHVKALAVETKNEGKGSSGFVSSTKLKCHYVSLFLAEKTAAGISHIAGIVHCWEVACGFTKVHNFHVHPRRDWCAIVVRHQFQQDFNTVFTEYNTHDCTGNSF